MCQCSFENTALLVLKLEYSRRTKSTPWLLMPWLLASPRRISAVIMLKLLDKCLLQRIPMTCAIRLLRNYRICNDIFIFPITNSAQPGLSIFYGLYLPKFLVSVYIDDALSGKVYHRDLCCGMWVALQNSFDTQYPYTMHTFLRKYHDIYK